MSINFPIILTDGVFISFRSAFLFIHYPRRIKMQKAFTTESATAAVVKIILEESGAGDVDVNSRILNVF